MDATVRFGVLGPVEARIAGREVPLGGPRARSVLAVLLLDANRVVPLDTVVDAAWGSTAPDTARFQAQNRISGLRRALREAGGREVIETAGAGYAIRLESDQLDALHFEAEVRQARRLAGGGDLTGGAQFLSRALRRWRGPALHGLTTPRLAAAARRLDETRLAAQELLVDIDLRRGRHHEVIATLLDLTASHPWREGLAAQLIVALYRSGRRREALLEYERTHRLLAEELGLDPGPELVRLRNGVLRDDLGPLAAA
jgi:DNA-binding SARP family transcriptional activator